MFRMNQSAIDGFLVDSASKTHTKRLIKNHFKTAIYINFGWCCYITQTIDGLW